jgi:glycosyltransferase involved in cell wall biosynthesis
MKIAIIGSRGYPYVYSGYETFIAEVAPRLAQQGVEVHVYCHKQLFAQRPAVVNNIHLHYIPSINSKSLSQLSNSLLATMHAVFHSYDVVLYVNAANGLFGPITKIFRKKTAINVDGLEWLRPKWKGLGAKVFRFSAKMATRWMDHIITDADAMRDVYLQEFNTDSSVIAYGANLRYSSNPALINQWNLQPNGYYLIVGRLIPDNNAVLIIEEFIKSNSPKKLVVVGDVPYNDAYAGHVKSIQDERLVFTGYVKDQAQLAELYHNCFAYFHGHEYGGTNPTLLKALAYGCCPLALDTVFSREVLKGDAYGLYFSKAAGSLQQLVEQLEQDDTALLDIKARSRQRITEHYTWEKIAGQYLQLFNNMANRRAK